MKADGKTLRTLFTSTLTLSAFTIGGGYVIVPLMKKRFVDELHWIDEEQMLEMIAIGQSAPGPIAINTSILVGHHIAGVPGALLTVLGTTIPPLVLLSILSVAYDMVKDIQLVAAMLRGMQAGVAAVISDVVVSMGVGVIRKKEALSIFILAAAFLAAAVFGVNVAFVIIAAGVIGGVSAAVRRRIDRKKGDDRS